VRIHVGQDQQQLAEAAASQAAAAIRSAIEQRGAARVVAATGASQFAFLEALTNHGELDWPSVELFQLDEYVGLSSGHPASFTKYLQERLVAKTGIVHYHGLDGTVDPATLVREANRAISAAPVDIAFAGIGENGHLAFNDPPADFSTKEPYLLVNLDEACRRQQVGEGWFASLAEVPERAISMSIHQILQAQEIVAFVPDERKARAVQACLEGEITPQAPASILRTHRNITLYLDPHSAALLRAETLSRFAAGSTREDTAHANFTAG
jgi:glucosamine-6-phosphate deaminase